MKFNLEIPGSVIDKMIQSISSYGFEIVIPSEVLQIVLLLWLDKEYKLNELDWKYLEECISITNL